MSDEEPKKHSLEPDADEPESSASQGSPVPDAADENLGGDYLVEEAPLGQVDAEGLLIQSPQTLPPPAAPNEAEAVPLDELDLGALLSAVPPQYQGEPEPPVSTLVPASESVVPVDREAPAAPPLDAAQLEALLVAAASPAPAHGGLDAVDPAALERLMAESAASPEAFAESVREADPVTEALVASAMDEAPLAGSSDLDTPVVERADAELSPVVAALAESPLAESVAYSSSPEAAVDVPEAPPEATPVAAPSGDISQEMIDALIAAAGNPSASAASEHISNENLAAAATAAAQVVPVGSAPVTGTGAAEEDDLDHLIEEAKRRAREQQAEAPLPEPAPTRERKLPRVESPLLKFLSKHGARAVASLAAGLLVAGGTFFWLYARQTRTPDLAVLVTQRGNAVEEAMDAARKMIDEGEYERAATTLAAAIEAAPMGRERTDAAYLRLEALYKAVPNNAPLSRYDAVQTEIDAVLSSAPDHPRVSDALHWKALLHERGELPFAALEAYERLIERYPDAHDMDETLVEAARLALDLGAPDKAARFADALVQRFPGSPRFAEAKLLQGDAYARTGQPDAARQLYGESLERSEDPVMRTEASLRLGRLTYDEGNYAAAIAQIRDYLSKTTTAEGNDAAYLLLAQALRKTGQHAEARTVLNDLLRFFPESKKAPNAYVELSQTLESLGERKAALLIAREGETHFPTNPEILKNLGELLGIDGNPFSAATTLIAADEAGAADPTILLTAARHLRTAGILDEAERTYRRLLESYGGSAESFVGGVELAQLYHERGDSKRAIERLENIALATEGSPQQLPALLAMADIYEELGLTTRAAQASEKAAGLTDDPQVLARAAAALIKSGGLTQGQAIVQRIDLAQVPPREAYQLLSALGSALLGVDPPRGIEALEEAYVNYPSERVALNDLALVRAYVAADRASAARRVVMDMVAGAEGRPENALPLLNAATAWGDYLYEQGDYRAASDAYLIADNAGAAAAAPGSGTTPSTDMAWARYQRANALFKLNELKAALALFEEIAQGNAIWAREAASKADIVRLQLRLRGETVPSLAQTPTGESTPPPAAG